jgi:hypothetical protein
MSDAQIIYLAWLVAVFVIRPPCFAVWVVCANALGILAVCGLMDVEALDRSNATLFMMIVDLLSGVALATRSGLSRVIAWGYALNVAIYSLNIVLGISLNATFALVYLIGLAQLGMLTIGPRGDNGSRNRRGRGAAPLFDAVSRRDSGIHAQGLGMGSNGDEVQG